MKCKGLRGGHFDPIPVNSKTKEAKTMKLCTVIVYYIVLFFFIVFEFRICVVILQVRLTQKQWFTCFNMYSPQSYLNVLSNQWTEMFQYLKYIEPRGCLTIPMFHPYSLTLIENYVLLHSAQILRSNQQRCPHQQCTAPAAARVHVSGRYIQDNSESPQHQRETKIMQLTNIAHSTKTQDAPRQPRTHPLKPPLPQPTADIQYQCTQSILDASAH